AEDGIRDLIVTGVQTCALPIFDKALTMAFWRLSARRVCSARRAWIPNRTDAAAARSATASVPAKTGLRRHQPHVRSARVMGRARSEERRVGKEWRLGWRGEWGQ